MFYVNYYNIDFLKIRKIPVRLLSYILPDNSDTIVAQVTIDEENDNLLKQVRDIILADRDLHDKGMKAFVSYVRFYTKHDASYIFRLKDLDLGKVAKGYGLLRLPKMPELKDCKISDFEEISINMDEYKYADKSREKKRRLKLAEEKLKYATQSDKMYKRRQLPKGSWSAKKLAKQRKVERKFKKARKKEFLKKRTADDMMNSKRIGVIDDEWKELQKEERLAKKLKKGKIKKEEFEEFERKSD